MDEHFKTLRFCHRLVLTYSITLLLITLSPDPAFRYEQAKEELERIQLFDVDVYVNKAIDAAELGDEKIQTSCNDLTPYSPDRQKFFRNLLETDEPQLIRIAHLFFVPHMQRSTVGDFFRFFDGDWVGDMCMTTNALVDLFDEHEKDILSIAGRVSRIRLTWVQHRFRRHEHPDVAAQSADYETMKELGFDMTAEGELDYLKFVEFFARHTNWNSVGLHFRESDDAYGVAGLTMTNQLMPSLGRTEAALGMVAPDSEAVEDAFPYVYSILDEVKRLNLQDAIRFLDRKIAKEKNHPTIYGVKINSDYANLIIPAVGFGLFLFLFVHLKGTSALLREKRCEITFPSLLFYSGTELKLARAATIVVFPVSVIEVCLFKLGGFASANHLIAHLAAACAFFAAISCWWVTEQINGLHEARTGAKDSMPEKNSGSFMNDEATRCAAKTKNGDPCTRSRSSESRYCWQHAKGPNDPR